MINAFKIIAITAFMFGLLLVPQAVQAHVLIRDTNNSSGAIVHIMPDDDPIAGQPSTIIFDIQNKALATTAYTATLQIINAAGQAVDVPLTINGNLLRAEYTFATQGVYILKLKLSSATTNLEFNHSQRVTRGVAGTAVAAQAYPWVQIALVGSISLFLLLIVIAINYRKDIAAYSKQI